MSSLRFTLNTAAVKPTAALRRAAEAGVVVGLSHRMFRDLAEELGGEQVAGRWLLKLANDFQRPVSVNFPTGKDTSSTVLIAPEGWTEERLLGWAGGLREALKEQYGEARIREGGR